MDAVSRLGNQEQAKAELKLTAQHWLLHLKEEEEMPVVLI